MSGQRGENEASESVAAAALDLAVGRKIVFTAAGHSYTWTFRRIERADWELFFRALALDQMHVLGEEVESQDIETGLVEIARNAVESVEGYRLAPGVDFRPLLPLGHLRSVAWLIYEVGAGSPPEDAPYELSELHEVHLHSTWTADAEGKMVRFSGLVHRFTPPTLKQQRAFNRAVNTTRIVGDRQNGRTIHAAKHSLMCDFYDEIVHSVDASYVWEGKPLSSRAEIVRAMDACHKVAAVQALLHAGGVGRIERRDAAEGEAR